MAAAEAPAPDALEPLWCDGVALWLVRLHHRPSEAALAALSVGERERAARFVFEADLRRYVAARAALRDRLGRHLGCSPHDLAFHVGPHGKPRLEEGTLHFNLSHSGDLALIGACDDTEIGVDIEAWRTVGDALELAESVFGPQERSALAGLAGAERDLAFLRGWTRKEACLKALGTGLSLSPQTFEVGLVPGLAQPVLGDGGGKVQVRSIEAPRTDGAQPPWVGAVAKRRGPAS